MKVFAILCVALFAGVALAQDVPSTMAPYDCGTTNKFLCSLKTLGAQISHHAKTLGGKLAEVGSGLLNTALDHATNLFSTGSQAVLGTVLEHVNNAGLGKREIALFSKVKEHFANGVKSLKGVRDFLKNKFESAVSKLTTKLADIASLKSIEDDADSKIDAIVAQWKEAGKGGFLQMASKITQKIKDVWAEAMAAVKGDSKTDKRAILDLFNKAKEHFNNLTGKLAETFQPHLDSLTAGVQGLADKAKEHGGKLVDSAKDSFNDLKDKLNVHLETLKGHASTLGDHATTSLEALKNAIGDIVAQATGNIAGTFGDILNTGVDASNTVINQIGDAVSN